MRPRGPCSLGLASLGLAVALSFEDLFFLAIIAGVIVVYFLVYALFSRWIYRATLQPGQGLLSNNVLVSDRVKSTGWQRRVMMIGHPLELRNEMRCIAKIIGVGIVTEAGCEELAEISEEQVER